MKPGHICTSWDHHVNDFLGIPFKYKSTNIDEGLDCWTLTCLFQERLRGITMPQHAEGYLHRKFIEPAVAQEKQWRRIEGKAVFGDILLFKPIDTILHVGVALDAHWMLHTTVGAYSYPEIFDNPAWLPRLEKAPYGIYRYMK